MLRTTTLAILLSLATPLAAELPYSGEDGFTTRHVLETDASGEAAWRMMTAHISQWWNPDHSWSGQASNLYLQADHPGCFCERLPDGGHVEHLRVIHISPPTLIRFDGALGPLQGMAVQGRMTWSIEATEAGSRITFNYDVFGHPQGGLAAIAPAVDGVIGEQLQRLGARLADH